MDTVFTKEDEERAKATFQKQIDDGEYTALRIAEDLENKGIVKHREPTEEEVLKQNRQFIMTCIAAKKRTHATEELANLFKQLNKIYTTRDDLKSEIWIYREGIYVPQGKTYIKEFVRKILLEAFTNQICNEVISKIEADTYIEQDEFFNNNYVYEIAIQNGILNVITKELTKFTPKKIFFNKLPLTYEDTKECPNIIKHFETVLKNPEEDILTIQEVFGFLLLKEYKIEKAIMLSGDGRNGKSKTIELVKRFLGVDNCSSIPLQQIEEKEFSISGLFGKMANISSDLSSKTLYSTGRFKEATGRDLITAPRKFLNPIKFENYAKFIFACNQLPITKDLTRAFMNRWVILEFPYTFMSKKEMDLIKDKKDLEKAKLIDPDIIEKLTTEEELSGLLNWALIGLERLLQKNDFSDTKETRKIWLRKSSSIHAFLMDFIVEDYEYKIDKKDFRRNYSLYCKTHKIKPVTDRIIHSVLMESYGCDESQIQIDGEMLRVWEGIKFKKGVEDKRKLSSFSEIHKFEEN